MFEERGIEVYLNLEDLAKSYNSLFHVVTSRAMSWGLAADVEWGSSSAVPHLVSSPARSSHVNNPSWTIQLAISVATL
jgi:hypothetical protein